MGIRVFMKPAFAALVLIAITPPSWNLASAQEAPVPEAPVGHRQPKASDVPKEEPVTPMDKTIDELDQALNKKLQGKICRGC